MGIFYVKEAMSVYFTIKNFIVFYHMHVLYVAKFGVADKVILYIYLLRSNIIVVRPTRFATSRFATWRTQGLADQPQAEQKQNHFWKKRHTTLIPV